MFRSTLICALILLCGFSTQATAQSTWQVSNVPGAEADFSDIGEALASADVQDEDWLEIAPSPFFYGDVRLEKRVNLRGLPDGSGQENEPVIASLEVFSEPADSGEMVFVTGLNIRDLTVERRNINLTSCRIGNLSINSTRTASVEQCWIALGEADRILVSGGMETDFSLTGNFIHVAGSGIFVRTEPSILSTLKNNTIVDETGTSEWVIYRGDLVNNILTVPAGRLALFDVEVRSNLSTRKTFLSEGNTDEVDIDALFAGDSDTIEAWLPAEGGPAEGTGDGDTDIGFTGGPTPLNPDDLPGLKTLPVAPPAPSLNIASVGIGAATLEWNSSEVVDGFELQLRIPEATFGESLSFDADTSGTLLDTLEEGTDYQFRLRALRDGLISDWTTSGIITTEISPDPPPAPSLSVTSVDVGAISLEWSSTEPVDSFELEFRQAEGSYTSGSGYLGDSTGVVWEVAPIEATYQFRLRATREGLNSDWMESEAVTTPEESDPLSDFKEIFGEDLTAAGDWYESGWFGWFADDSNGYIYHLNHGSLFPIGDADSLFVYDSGLGLWIWTSQLVYPSIYFFDAAPDWFLYYRGTSTPERWFYEYSTGEDIREDQFE